MATSPRHAENDSATETAQQGMRKAADQAAHTSRTMAEAGERTARAGADAFRRNAESISNTWRSGRDAVNRIAERSMDQVYKAFGLTGDTARQTMQQSSGNMQAVMESTTVIAGGLQDVTGEWIRFAQSRAEQNLDHFDRLLECRSIQELLAIQTQIVRDNVEAMLQSARRTAERSTQVADEAVRRMSEASLAPR